MPFWTCDPWCVYAPQPEPAVTVAQGSKCEDRIDLSWLFAGLEPALRADWLQLELRRRRRARVWR